MELAEALRKRRSCRRFLPGRTISRETALELVAAGVEAPTAGNIQPWRFYLVWEDELRARLADAARGQDFIRDAGLIVAICADLELCYGAYGRRGRDLYAVQDCAAAAENILLKAAEMGLASCWIGAFDDDQVARILETGFRPQALLAIGTGAGEKPKPRRRDIDNIVFFRNS